jgi:predicted nucleic acid-binding protein
MIVFADTSALFALLVRDDRMHLKARKNFAWFAAQGVQLITSSYVLVETIALLQRRIGLPAVNDFNAKIAPVLEIVWVDAVWHNQAIQRLITQGRGDLSLVDCLSFEIMEAREIRVAYAFDRHFSDNGFSLAAYNDIDIQ